MQTYIENSTEKKDTTYNGWKNRQTWNVALYIANEEPLYRAARAFMAKYAGKRPYAAFIRSEGMERDRTPDNIGWISTRLDYPELNAFMRELIS